ncbi:MAG: putative transposase [Pseudomonadales bacterium]|jgi:putative transposase
MKKRTRPTLSPEFRLEASQLVVDQNYTVIAAVKAMNVGISTMAKWVAQLKQERQGKPYAAVTPMTPDQLKIRELEKRIARIEMEKEILKKGYRSLDVGFTEQLKLVRRHQGSYPTTVLCKQFDVCRSTYKYWCGRPSVINYDKIKLRALVNEKHKLSNGSAGSRSIAAMVSQDVINLSRYRASRLMKDLGLVSCQLPKHAYKKALQPYVAIPNHLTT